MKLLVVGVVLLVGCGGPRWYEATPSPGQKTDLRWGVDVLVLDPLTTDAADVDDLHKQRKRAVCEVGSLDLLQVCSDKGFDAVTFTESSDEMLKRAGELGLPVLIVPSGSAGRKTTTGS